MKYLKSYMISNAFLWFTHALNVNLIIYSQIVDNHKNFEMPVITLQ